MFCFFAFVPPSFLLVPERNCGWTEIYGPANPPYDPGDPNETATRFIEQQFTIDREAKTEKKEDDKSGVGKN